jgi:hypothetical protein
MAIAKNNTPGKLAPSRRTAILEEEAPAPRKARISPTKPETDRPAPVANKQTITVLESILEERGAISPELRQHMIRDAAYYRAERRGFTGGDPMQDWVEAEAEINRMLGGSPSSGRKKSQSSH